jgi:hypothetical protein
MIKLAFGRSDGGDRLNQMAIALTNFAFTPLFREICGSER